MKLKMVLSWYNVTDMAAATKFYTETLGLKKIFEMPGWAEFAEDKDAPAVGIAENKQWTPGATVVFRVADLDATRAEMEARGVKFDPTEVIPGAVKLAKFRDPQGNVLQLAQPLMTA